MAGGAPGSKPRNPPSFASDPLNDVLKRALEAHRSGRLDEARAGYEQTLALEPSDHNALTNLGALFLQLGRFEEGLQFIDRSLAHRPNQPGAIANKATGLACMGRFEEALQALEGAPVLDEAGADAGMRIGDVFRERREWPAALRAYDLSLRWRPDHTDTLVRRGVILVELRRFQEARTVFEAVLVREPHNAGARFNLGVALHKLQRLDEALQAFDQAEGLDPGTLQTARGNTLRELGRMDEALMAYRQSLGVRPDASTWCELGIALVQLQHLEEAKAAFDEALGLSPGNPFFLSNLACALLAAGRYEEAWPAYEARWNGPLSDVRLPQPRWSPGSEIQGRTVLLIGEQGLGDVIQFVRYAPMVAARGARVVLAVPPPLVGICRSIPGVAAVVADADDPPAFDICCPVMSLPLLCGTTLQTVPADGPYLRADPGKAAAWSGKLGRRTRPRVGLVWSGGFRPDQPELWTVNNRRNVPLALFAALADCPVEFHSLQKGEPAESELREAVAQGWDGPPIADHAADLRDFSDTAALIENLDLVIAVDTSTAHLAGALGKPLWILNRYDTCWRWMLERADSPWYPAARLFRQPSLGDWPAVMRELRQALMAFAASGD
jgi:tetratricopeptide (TPR) repeat protein